MTQEEKLLHDEILPLIETAFRASDPWNLSVVNEILNIIKDLGLDLKSKNWYDEQRTSQRMNVIGQNGNEGTHYER